MLTAEEIAERLNVCRRTVIAMAERREIPCYRDGRLYRFDEVEVKQAIKATAEVKSQAERAGLHE